MTFETDSKLASGGEQAVGQLAAEAVETTEGQLLAELRAGRSSAYAMLVRRNNQRLYRLARSILRDDADSGRGGARARNRRWRARRSEIAGVRGTLRSDGL
jgi:hypothetical protein